MLWAIKLLRKWFNGVMTKKIWHLFLAMQYGDASNKIVQISNELIGIETSELDADYWYCFVLCALTLKRKNPKMGGWDPCITASLVQIISNIWRFWAKHVTLAIISSHIWQYTYTFPLVIHYCNDLILWDCMRLQTQLFFFLKKKINACPFI